MASRAAREIAKKRDAHQRKVDSDYRNRHPERARQERGFRKDQAQLRKDWGHKRHGTPETHAKASRVRQGSLARMYEAGHLSIDQLAASQSIRWVAERIGADVAIGTVSLETRVDQSRGFERTFFEKLGAVRAEIAYTMWRAQLAQPAPVLAMIVQEVSCSAAAKSWGMRKSRAKAMLIDALDLWDEMIGRACDEVDEATLAAAQAGIL